MKLITGCAAAVAAVVCLAGTAPAQTGDTMRLGVVNIGGANAASAAPIATLKYTPEDKPDTLDTSFFHPYARGYFHGANGFGYRPWVGYYRPFVRPYFYGFYRPWVGIGFYRPYYYGGYYPSVAYGYSYPVSAVVAASPVAAYSPYPCDTPAPAYGALATPAPPYAAPAYSTAPPAIATAETLPVPRQTGGFRYDGGPLAPVPMPDGSRPMPMTQPSQSNVIAATNTVSTTVAKTRIAYPAYGEELPQLKPSGSILVKKPGQK